MRRLLAAVAVAGLVAAAVSVAAPDQPPREADERETKPADAGQAPPMVGDAPATQPAVLPFKTAKERISYAIGMDIGNAFKMRSLDIDVDLMGQAIKDVVAGRPTTLTQDQARETMMAWQQEQRAEFQRKQQELGEKNKKEGEEFLAKNKEKEGWVALPSGLQYKEVRPGSGECPKATDTVKVHYRGTLLDGTEFDNSAKRGTGEPASFTVGGVIKGWTEALQLMKPGAKWQLAIPSHLAYAESGSRNIGPNATLLFDVELVSVEAPATRAASTRPARTIQIGGPNATRTAP